MDTIREQLNRPVVAAAVGLVLGLLIGWFLLGWGLFPVSWTDASPEFLRSDLKEDYLRMTIESFSKNQDRELALQRYNSLGEEKEEILTAVRANPQNTSPADIETFTTVVLGEPTGPVLPGATTAPGALVTSTPTTAAGGQRSLLPVVLGVMCALMLIIAGALAYLFIVRGRAQRGGSTPAMQAQDLSRQAERTDYGAQGQEAPVAQFMTTYMAGDDLYDDSFSIDSPSGEFLGECGVGISDTIGVGDPKKVTAFEVWLFDKNDIQTVTKVLMSAHAFNDPTISQRLESKGEPVLAEPGKRVLLETATLQLEARVVDMNYGQGALPANSFFERLTLELAIWPKPAQA